MVRSSSTRVNPGGSPFGETSQLPSPALVATRQNGEAASRSRSTSAGAVGSLARAAGIGSPSSARSCSSLVLSCAPGLCHGRSKASIVNLVTIP